jgi:hypothetical protein
MILFVNRLSDPNIGDRLANPIQYFRHLFLDAEACEIHMSGTPEATSLAKILKKRASGLVIGGGGLLGQPYFNADLKFWCDAFEGPKIFWGGGHNSHDPHGLKFAQASKVRYSGIQRFDIVGLRDSGSPYAWVPCVSCMHPAQKMSRGSGRRYAFLLHRDTRANPNFLAELSPPDDAMVVYNDEPFSVVLGAIRQSGAVVTNSYHGAYWSTLTGRKVVVVGGGTKVTMMKHSPAYAAPSGWKAALESAHIYPDALEECRQVNLAFAERVKCRFAGMLP